MLKKIIVLVGLAASLMASAAWAGERGAASGTGFSPVDDRASACSRAKSNADGTAPYGATITGHSSCDCSPDRAGGSQPSWTCTVDAYWEKK